MNPTSNAPLRVLVVEDSTLAVDQIREILNEVPAPMDIRVAQAQNDALATAQNFVPDVVVLDLQLKQGTGFGVLKALGTKSPKPKFIVLTNYALPNYRNYALLAGADYFLDKSKDIQVLQFVVESIARARD